MIYLLAPRSALFWVDRVNGRRPRCLLLSNEKPYEESDDHCYSNAEDRPLDNIYEQQHIDEIVFNNLRHLIVKLQAFLNPKHWEQTRCVKVVREIWQRKSLIT